MEKFSGFKPLSSNYIDRIPNQFFDLVVRNEKECVIKIVGMIFRYTNGFRDENGNKIVQREFSLSYLEKITGLSRNSVITALAIAIEKGYVEIVKESDGNIGKIYKVKWESNSTSAKFAQVEKTQGSAKFEPQVVQNLNHNNEKGSAKFEPNKKDNIKTIKKENIKNNNILPGQMLKMILEKVSHLKINQDQKKELTDIFNVIHKNSIFVLDISKDIDLFKELIVKYSQIDFGDMLVDMKWFNKDRKTSANPRPRLQIRNWCKTSIKYNKNLKGGKRVSQNTSTQGPGSKGNPGQAQKYPSKTYSEMPKV